MSSRKYLIFMILAAFASGCGNNDNTGSINASGTIESTNIIVSSKTSGEVLKLLVDEGAHVKAGDTIVIIDHSLLDIQLKQASANVDLTSAQLSLMRNGARSEDIKQTEEVLKQAEINFNLSEKDKERMQNLYDSKSITKKQYEDALAKYEITEAQYNAARENYKKIKNFARPEEIKQADANLKKAESGAELIKKNIKDCYVTAPMDGFVVKKFMEQGETVNPMSSLFKISDLSVVDLVIYVSEEELGSVKLGQKAEVSVDAFKNKKFEGQVIYISPEAEFTPKNIQTKDERTKLVFAVKIRIKNPAFELKPGMPADATVKTGS
jgi:HlyD family secretion protein